MNKSLRGKVRPGRRQGLLPLSRRLTSSQSSTRSEKILTRVIRREIAAVRAKKSRKKKES